MAARYLRTAAAGTRLFVLFGFTLFLFLRSCAWRPGARSRCYFPRSTRREQTQAAHALSSGSTDPLYVQYFDFISAARTRQSRRLDRVPDSGLADSSFERLPATIELSACALLLTTFIALPLGVLNGRQAARAASTAAGTLADTASASRHPVFWLGALLIISLRRQAPAASRSRAGDRRSCRPSAHSPDRGHRADLGDSLSPPGAADR